MQNGKSGEHQNTYDYIIAGAGASGLSLAWQMLQTEFAPKKVLIVDSNLSPRHDKTWCFWDSENAPFSDIIRKKWKQLEIGFHDERFIKPLDEYTYYCIPSDKFQQKIFKAVREAPNFELLEASIKDLQPTNQGATLRTKEQSFKADYIFQSCFVPEKITEAPVRYPLLQHFLGWSIKAHKPAFNSSTFTLMDFDDTFNDGIAFMYALPWSKKEMLIEYTLFSEDLLPQKKYEEKINLYLHNRFGLQQIDYQITRKEMGEIPMQDRPDCRWFAPRILNLGTQGGMTKPSTGYTFSRIQHQVKTITKQLLTGEIPKGASFSKNRFKAYDLWLLHLIDRHPGEALQVFHDLFSNNSMDDVFRFLGEKSSVRQDLKIIKSLPSIPFLKAIPKTFSRMSQIFYEGDKTK